MTPLELAEQYLACFFGEKKLSDMRSLLADDLCFRGPLFAFDSADAYVASLERDPPVNMKCEILEAFGHDRAACVIYRFRKPGVDTRMAQLFRVEGGRISHIDLVFDSKAFSGHSGGVSRQAE